MRYSTILAVVIVIILAISGSMIYIVHSDFKHSTSTGNAIIIPIYSDPSNQWDVLINVHKEYHEVKMYAIINPDNGSGSSFNYSYSQWTYKLKSVGIVTLGYVYTSYGNRPIKEVESEIRNYSKWYGITSIFFDEVSEDISGMSYYRELMNYSGSIGISFVIGNPGDTVPYSYLDIFNTTVIYEDPGYPDIQALSKYSENISGTKIAVISYGVQFSLRSVESINNFSKVIYVSNWNLPDPYQNISSYLPQLAKALE